MRAVSTSLCSKWYETKCLLFSSKLVCLNSKSSNGITRHLSEQEGSLRTAALTVAAVILGQTQLAESCLMESGRASLRMASYGLQGGQLDWIKTLKVCCVYVCFAHFLPVFWSCVLCMVSFCFCDGFLGNCTQWTAPYDSNGEQLPGLAYQGPEATFKIPVSKCRLVRLQTLCKHFFLFRRHPTKIFCILLCVNFLWYVFCVAQVQ